MKAKFVYQSLREGVADKYASANFGITDPDEEFELQWAGQQLSGRALTWIHGYPLIKNPKSLEHFVPNILLNSSSKFGLELLNSKPAAFL